MGGSAISCAVTESPTGTFHCTGAEIDTSPVNPVITVNTPTIS
jgi:hypothetical protein